MKNEQVKFSNQDEKIRLHKRIADSGLCSRRTAEKWILEGRVKVDGKLVKVLGSKVTGDQEVTVNGKALAGSTKTITLMMNKPVGIVCTRSDPEGRRTVMDLLPPAYRHLKPVGRLDQDTEGLLLLTSDGDLCLRLTHPRFEHKKTYLIQIEGKLTQEDEKRIREGRFQIAGRLLNPMELKILKQKSDLTELELTLTEGRKRQIRRIFDRLGHTVLRLRRVAINTLDLGKLKPGSFRLLKPDELRILD